MPGPIYVYRPGHDPQPVSAKDLPAALDAGARLASDDQVRAWQTEQKYGGLGGAAIAAGEGAARGLTFGAIDPLAVAIGGEGVREHLAGYKEAHPYAAFGGELAGAVAPVLATGGAGAAEEGIGLASTLRGLGAIPSATGALGRGAASIAEHLLPAGESALTRALSKGAAHAAQGAVEGGIFGVGNQISEDALGKADTTAEKLVAAFGMNALLGGGVGGGLGAMGSLSSDATTRLLEAVAPHADTWAGQQAIRALGARKAYTKLIDAAGGQAAFAERIMPYMQVGGTVQELAERLTQATDEAGAGVNAIRAEADQLGVEGPKVAQVIQDVHPAVKELAKMARTNRGAMRALENVIKDMEEFAGAEMPALPKEGPAPKAPTLEKSPGMRAKLPKLQDFPEGKLPSEPSTKGALGNTVHPEAPGEYQAPPRVESDLFPEDYGNASSSRGGWTNERHANGRKLLLEEYADKVGSYEGKTGELQGIERQRRAEILERYADELSESEVANNMTEQEVMLNNRQLLAKYTEELSAGKTDVANTKRWNQNLLEGYADALAEHEGKGAAAKAEYLEKLAAAQEKRMTFQQAAEFRAKLDDHINWNTNPLAPTNEKTVALQKVRSALEDNIEKQMDAAAEKLGPDALARYKESKLAYRQLRIARDAAKDSALRQESNSPVGLRDVIIGAGALATGHMAGALMMVGSKLAREHGPQTAAVMLRKASKLASMATAAREIDGEISSTVKHFFGKATDKAVSAATKVYAVTTPPTKKSLHEEYSEAVSQINDLASNPDKLQRVLALGMGDMGEHAPNTAAGISKKATFAIAYMQSKIPPSPASGRGLTPHLSKIKPSDAEMASAMRSFNATRDPMSAIRSLRKDRMTREAGEALRVVYPEIFNEVNNQTVEEMAKLKTPISYKKRAQVGYVLGISPDATFDSAFIVNIQKSYQNGDGGGQPAQRPRTAHLEIPVVMTPMGLAMGGAGKK